MVWGEGVYVMDGRGFGGMACMFVNSSCSISAYVAIPLCVCCVLHGEDSSQCMAR